MILFEIYFGSKIIEIKYFSKSDYRVRLFFLKLLLKQLLYK